VDSNPRSPVFGDVFGGAGRDDMAANGSEDVSDLVVLREVKVGEHVVRNVTASISPPRGEPLLIGGLLEAFEEVLDLSLHLLIRHGLGRLADGRDISQSWERRCVSDPATD
jgi:hypothetical protein